MINLKNTGIICLLLYSSITFAQKSGSLENSGIYKMNLGNVEIFAILDGNHSINVKQLLHGISGDSISKLMHQNSLDTNYNINFSAFLIKRAGERILVDAGCGEFMGPDAGRLTGNLATIGVGPKDITAVLITHAHADHLGGLIENGMRRFPKATVYISKIEADYWLSSSNKAMARKDDQPIFDIVSKSLSPYVKTKQLRTFTAGNKILEGITTINAQGHTPGSTAYQLRSNGQSILFIGDLAHIAAIQYSIPSVIIDWDISQSAAASTREKQFSKLAVSKSWVAGPHMPFPGIGHIISKGQGFQWIPIEIGAASAPKN